MAEKAKPKNYETLTLGMVLTGSDGSKQKPGSRKVPMKVLCLGMPRTGTISLRKALHRLGYGPCYHMLEYYAHPEHTPFWSRAVNAKWEKGPPIQRSDWDTVLGTYQSVADSPCAWQYRELIALYPHAKVILTNKDPDAFWRSWSQAVQYAFTNPWYVWLTTALAFDGGAQSLHATVRRRGVDHAFGGPGKALDEGNVKKVFREHYDEVRSLVPKERLLEYRIEQGWGPLCAFLGEDVPDEEFPKGNSTKDFEGAVNTMRSLQIIMLGAKVGVLGFVGFALWKSPVWVPKVLRLGVVLGKDVVRVLSE